MKFLCVLFVCYVIGLSGSLVASQDQEPNPDDDDGQYDPELDAKYNFADQGREPIYPDGVNTIPGEAETNYPVYNSIMKTSFSCIGRPAGFYADLEARCQVWHICDVDERMQSFLCTNGTIFSQAKRVCEWWYNTNCEVGEVEKEYEHNRELYITPELDALREAKVEREQALRPASRPKPQQRPASEEQEYSQAPQQKPAPSQREQPQQRPAQYEQAQQRPAPSQREQPQQRPSQYEQAQQRPAPSQREQPQQRPAQSQQQQRGPPQQQGEGQGQRGPPKARDEYPEKLTLNVQQKFSVADSRENRFTSKPTKQPDYSNERRSQESQAHQQLSREELEARRVAARDEFYSTAARVQQENRIKQAPPSPALQRQQQVAESRPEVKSRPLQQPSPRPEVQSRPVQQPSPRPEVHSRPVQQPSPRPEVQSRPVQQPQSPRPSSQIPEPPRKAVDFAPGEAPQGPRQKFRHSTPRKHNVKFADGPYRGQVEEERQIPEETQQYNPRQYQQFVVARERQQYVDAQEEVATGRRVGPTPGPRVQTTTAFPEVTRRILQAAPTYQTEEVTTVQALRPRPGGRRRQGQRRPAGQRRDQFQAAQVPEQSQTVEPFSKTPKPFQEAPVPKPLTDAPVTKPFRETPKPKPFREDPVPKPFTDAPVTKPFREALKPKPFREDPVPRPFTDAPKPFRETPKPRTFSEAPVTKPFREAPGPKPFREASTPIPVTTTEKPFPEIPRDPPNGNPKYKTFPLIPRRFDAQVKNTYYNAFPAKAFSSDEVQAPPRPNQITRSEEPRAFRKNANGARVVVKRKLRNKNLNPALRRADVVAQEPVPVEVKDPISRAVETKVENDFTQVHTSKKRCAVVGSGNTFKILC